MTEIEHAGMLFALAFGTNLVNATITYAMVRFNFPLAIITEGAAWTLWLLTVKVVYAAGSLVEYAGFVGGAMLGLFVTMKLNYRYRASTNGQG